MFDFIFRAGVVIGLLWFCISTWNQITSWFSPSTTVTQARGLTPREQMQHDYGYIPDWMPPDDMPDPTDCKANPYTPYCTTGRFTHQTVTSTSRDIKWSDECVDGNAASCSKLDASQRNLQALTGMLQGSNAADAIRSGVGKSQQNLRNSDVASRARMESWRLGEKEKEARSYGNEAAAREFHRLSEQQAGVAREYAPNR